MKRYLVYEKEIEGLSDVKETVRVIEKSAAAHIHFLRIKVEALADYKNQIQQTLWRFLFFYNNLGHPLLEKRGKGKNILLVLSGSKGMVGGLYHQIINEVLYRKNSYSEFWVVGSKGAQYLREEGIEAKEIEEENVGSEVFQRFLEKKHGIAKIDIVYPAFLSLVMQQPDWMPLLPFNFPSAFEKGNNVKEELESGGLPLFEPSFRAVFDVLLKKYIGVVFNQLMMEAKLSEFSARTVTAESALKETEEIVFRLRRAFLKEKHRFITQKQIENFSAHQIIK